MDGTNRNLVFALCLALSALSACGGGGQTTASAVTLPQENLPGSPKADPDFADRSEAVGFYTNGTVANAAAFPLESYAHLKIFQLRDRSFGTETLINVIVNAAKEFRNQFPTGDRVQIGDAVSQFGGSQSRHASHQNGLDADIAYLQSDQVERNPNDNGPNGFGASLVSNGKLTSNFDLKRNWYFLKALVNRQAIGRIFVDPAIKSAFCAKSMDIDPNASPAMRTEVLRRIRPYANHADHLHVRVKCPANSPKCVDQEELPAGSGCSNIQSVSEAEHGEEHV